MDLDRPTRQLLRDPKKRWAWILYQCNLRGFSLASLASRHGVVRETLYQVRHKRYPRMERIIAEALGLTPKDLWPERYDDDGLPSRRKSVATAPDSHESKDTGENGARNRNLQE
jgi:Ner family transcriptional regulator